MVKLGDKVKVDGAVASVIAIWAQGKHTKYVLSDKREILDLHARKDLEIVAEAYSPDIWDSIPTKAPELPEVPPVHEFDDEV